MDTLIEEYINEAGILLEQQGYQYTPNPYAHNAYVKKCSPTSASSLMTRYKRCGTLFKHIPNKKVHFVFFVPPQERCSDDCLVVGLTAPLSKVISDTLIRPSMPNTSIREFLAKIRKKKAINFFADLKRRPTVPTQQLSLFTAQL